MYNLRVFSPNYSCNPLRSIPFNRRVLLRLGSTTPLVSKYKYLEINSINGIKISANKILMKKAFDKAQIKHSEWINSTKREDIIQFFNTHKIIIAKHKHSSKGKDIYYIDNMNTLEDVLSNNNIKKFVFEKYYFFPSEYRVHIDVNTGCFYCCKKVLKEGANVEWHKHADNSIFVLITDHNKLPIIWDEMIEACQKILKQMDLSIACFDILCSKADYIIVESNTAASLASVGINFYANHLKKYYDCRY